MKVLQIHKDFEPLKGGGGTARHIHGLARALVEFGCEVRVVAPEPETITHPYSTASATALHFGRHIGWADVVHVHGARSKYAFAGATMAALAGKPFFYTPHAFYEPHDAVNAATKKIWDKTAEKFMLERGAQTILLTPYWRTWLATRGISSDRTTIIPNCILGKDLQPLPADAPPLPGHPAILSVGRLDHVKRIDDVIRAIARPELAAAHLHIVGKGEQRGDLEQLARELDVAERVTFHGFVDDAGVARMMAGSHCFVLASEQEGLPTVLLESLMGGLPVVCTQIPGNLAITQVAGVDSSYAVGDVAALASLLAISPSLTVSEQAKAALRREFTWEHRAGDVLALYESSLQPMRKAA